MLPSFTGVIPSLPVAKIEAACLRPDHDADLNAQNR